MRTEWPFPRGKFPACIAHGDDDLGDAALRIEAVGDAALARDVAALLQVQSGAEGRAGARQHHDADVAPPVQADEEVT